MLLVEKLVEYVFKNQLTSLLLLVNEALYSNFMSHLRNQVPSWLLDAYRPDN